MTLEKPRRAMVWHSKLELLGTSGARQDFFLPSVVNTGRGTNVAANHSTYQLGQRRKNRRRSEAGVKRLQAVKYLLRLVLPACDKTELWLWGHSASQALVVPF